MQLRWDVVEWLLVRRARFVGAPRPLLGRLQRTRQLADKSLVHHGSIVRVDGGKRAAEERKYVKDSGTLGQCLTGTAWTSVHLGMGNAGDVHKDHMWRVRAAAHM